MANSTRAETVSRSVCYQILEAAGCSWERRIELFHIQLAQLDGPNRAVRLAELVVIESEQLHQQSTLN